MCMCVYTFILITMWLVAFCVFNRNWKEKKINPCRIEPYQTKPYQKHILYMFVRFCLIESSYHLAVGVSSSFPKTHAIFEKDFKLYRSRYSKFAEQKCLELVLLFVNVFLLLLFLSVIKSTFSHIFKVSN